MGLVDLHAVVGQVKVHHQVDPGAIERVVVPIGLETQHLPIIQQKLCDLCGWCLANLELCKRLGIRRGARHGQSTLLRSLPKAVCLLPLVVHHRLILAHVDAILLVEPTGETVTSTDVVPSPVDGDLLATTQIVRPQEALAVVPRHLMPLQKHPLRNARVLNRGLLDLQGAVLHVVVDCDVSDAAVLVAALGDALLEESVEAEDLLVVFQPRRRHPGMDHVLWHAVLRRGRGLHALGRSQAPSGAPQHLGKAAGLSRWRHALVQVHR
mmetsp:Transcript_90589/g.293236  ORF Transcript_90589/g.293236 Transcript_90589/m.293236 type:complete len:267 (+) Transcript_90589:1143-1943(+)